MVFVFFLIYVHQLELTLFIWIIQYAARTTPAVSFTLNWRWDCDMVGLFMVCEKASLPDAVGLRSLKSRAIIALNLRAGVYSSNTLSLIFSLSIHLLLSKCEIRTCCVTLAYFSATFRFKMHCIIFGRLPIIFALPISGIVLHESDSQPGVLLGLKKLQFIYMCICI